MTAPLHRPEPPPRPSHLRALAAPDDRTTLKWASNGELSELDHQRILHRLCAADPAACQLLGATGSELDAGSAATALWPD